MTATTSKRNKYVREMKATWWTKLDIYKLYIVREATSIPTLWFCLVLFYGLTCLSGGVADVKENFIPFLQNPLVVILNIITLAAMILNTVTYYVMTPKVMNIIVKDERLNPNIVTTALWVITALVSIITLVLIYK